MSDVWKKVNGCTNKSKCEMRQLFNYPTNECMQSLRHCLDSIKTLRDEINGNVAANKQKRTFLPNIKT